VIRVLIAAPSAVMRSGLETLIASSPSMELAGVYPDLSALDSLRPDVVLSTLMPQEQAPPLVWLSAEAQPAWTPDLLRLGVRAQLPRDASAAEILAAVEAASAGFAAIDPRDLEALLGSASPAAAAAEPALLTARELEVLRMLAEGAANKTIAWKLNISEHTVKFHVASILGKLNAASRTEAVTMGIRRGWILI
jgi:DNA-binding NarL/FixJ family response regulator